MNVMLAYMRIHLSVTERLCSWAALCISYKCFDGNLKNKNRILERSPQDFVQLLKICLNWSFSCIKLVHLCVCSIL